MAEQVPTINWKGAKGTYLFYIFPLSTDLLDTQDGNYIFTKIVNNVWKPIYIGEGNLGDRTKAGKKDHCIIEKGATHIHAHINYDENARKNEETDLLNGHSEAYVPNGCNIKKGG